MSDETYPYAPEGADKIGKPPVGGQGGERGSSAYEGDEGKGFGGPARGVEYYQSQHPRAVDSGLQGQSAREPATASADGGPRAATAQVEADGSQTGGDSK